MMSELQDSVPPPRQVGRYVLFGEIASGGMAAVHFGLLNGPVGFRRTVAIKRLHDNFARDPSFVSQFLDEARLAARIRHPNVVQTLDVVAGTRELLLVMEYVDGETLADLRRLWCGRAEGFPIDMAVGILVGALHGLDAAHDAKDENGVPLNIVHRDVSPQNIIVGRDGVPRVLDFGVAKAAARFHSTQGELVKGKLKYMAPEQVTASEVDRRTDVFAAGIVLWETLTGRTLFDVPDGGAAAVIHRVLNTSIERPSIHRPDISPELDAAVLKALARDPRDRYQTALEFSEALEEVVRIPTPRSTSRWVMIVASEVLKQRAEQVASIEKRATHSDLDTLGGDMLSGLSGQTPSRQSIPPSSLSGPNDDTAVVSPIASVSPTDRTDRSHVRRRTWLLRLAVLLLLGGAAAALFFGGILEGEAGVDQPPSTSPTFARGVVSARPRANASFSTPSPPEAPSVLPSAIPQRPSPSHTGKRKDCKNPTYVDKDGIRKFRVECL